jgi:zinc transporter
VVTARYKPLRFIEWMLPRLATLNVTSSTALLAFLLEEQEEVLEQVVRQASRHVDDIEERLLTNHVQRNRADLARLRRMLLRFQRLLAPEPAAMFRLLNRPPAWIDRSVVQEFRQFTEEFTVVLNDLSGLTERISLLQEEISARQMEKQPHAIYLDGHYRAGATYQYCGGVLRHERRGIPLSTNHHGFILLVLLVGGFTLGPDIWPFGDGTICESGPRSGCARGV